MQTGSIKINGETVLENIQIYVSGPSGSPLNGWSGYFVIPLEEAEVLDKIKDRKNSRSVHLNNGLSGEFIPQGTNRLGFDVKVQFLGTGPLSNAAQ